jgi:MFS family permease
LSFSTYRSARALRTPEAVKDYVQQNLRWNMGAGIVDAMFIMLAMQVISTETVIPLLITRLGATTVVLGIVMAINSVVTFVPQLFAAGTIEERTFKKPVSVICCAIDRIGYLLIGLALWAWGATAPVLALAAFVVIRALAGSALGFSIPAWLTLIGKVIPTRRRGVFLGIGRGIGSLLGVGGAFLAGHLLDTQPFPRSFAFCFFIAFGAMVLSWTGLTMTKEPPDLNVKPRPPLGTYFARLPALLKQDRNFRRFLIARPITVLGTMAMSFIIIYSSARFALSGSAVGGLTATSALSQGVMYMVWGLIADRRGHKTVLCLGAAAMAGAALSAAISPTVTGVYIAFALVGAAVSAEMISATSILLEFAPPADRPTYIGLSNTFVAPFRILAPILGGALAASLGYGSLFAIATCVSCAGVALMVFRVQEPRLNEERAGQG